MRLSIKNINREEQSSHNRNNIMNTNEVNQKAQEAQKWESDFLQNVAQTAEELSNMADNNKGLGFIIIGVDMKEGKDKDEVSAISAIVGSGRVLVGGLRSVLGRDDVPFRELVSKAAMENMFENLSNH